MALITRPSLATLRARLERAENRHVGRTVRSVRSEGWVEGDRYHYELTYYGPLRPDSARGLRLAEAMTRLSFEIARRATMEGQR